MPRLSLWKSVLVSTTLGLVGACSSNKETFDSTPSGFEQDAAVEADSECAGVVCSRDLHSVQNSCGDVIQRCSETSACANGNCVSACDGAAASQGSIGCDFWAVPPDTIPGGDSSCYTAFVANTWTLPVKVTAEYGSSALDISKSVYKAVKAADGSLSYELLEDGIPPGEVGIVFLSEGPPQASSNSWIACPAGVNVAFHGKPVAEHRTSLYEAFHLKTDLPVSAYSMFPYGGAQSYLPTATLLYPTPSWDTNYVLVDGWSSEWSFVQIVAQEDNTEVRIRPVIDIPDTTTIAGTPKGFVGTWKLDRGQVLEFNLRESLGGSPVETTHPVALFGGTPCPDIPEPLGACDTLHQQIPAVRQWASRYSAVPYESRRRVTLPAPPETVNWRIAGARDGTVLRYDPAPPSGAPTKIGAGQIVSFTSDAPFTVQSQGSDYPFYLAVYMSGAQLYASDGDPDFVNVIPDEQFLDHYVFFVDYTYEDSNLTLVRRKDHAGFHDVNLDCLGTVTGWQPLGDGSTEYAWVDLTRDEQPVGNCSWGRHEATSDGPFGLYVWGQDFCASYGYPAGAGSRPTTTYTVPVR